MKIGLDTTFVVQVSVREHPGHAAARAELAKCLDAGDTFAMAPQVVAEFIHIVTDPRRFEHPLSAAAALATARDWWSASQVQSASPTPESMKCFFGWMEKFGLGRKRLLDTLLAATYFTHDVHTILSSNARDYTIFGCFHVIVPA